LPEYRFGRPAIVYFKTDGCGPCESIQGPALAEIQTQLGEGVQVIQIDAFERVDLAKTWGVLTVPTTFLIDSLGRPRGVNQGAVGAPRLLAQMRPYIPSAAGGRGPVPFRSKETDSTKVNVE
jgi:thiol-disulfide isomerase/thioredoxin